MSFRNAFNGGELSPTMQMRSDLDVFARGCSVVENFDVGQTGGLVRRRGFRYFADALGVESRLFEYRYRNDLRYLVEVGSAWLRVFDVSGALLFRAAHGYSADELSALHTLQINALLLLLSGGHPPMQLRCDSNGVWSLSEFEFSVPPWRYSDLRDFSVTVGARSDGRFSVFFNDEGDDEAAESEYTALQPGELLRVSYFTEAQQIRASAADLFARVGECHFEEGFINGETQIARGTVLAVRRAPEYVVYSVVKDTGWKGATQFFQGMIDPANYATYFQVASDASAYDVTISELSADQTYTKGQRVRFEQGYWELFTCIKDFDGGVDFHSGSANPEDYSGHFARGVMLGSAPCKGSWNFYPQGCWYGSYEVRAAFSGTGAEGDAWEYRAESFSRNASPANNQLAGNESSEECWLSLWLTRIRAYGSVWGVRNFPADGCGNLLTVAGYKHDLVLRSVVSDDDAYFEQVERIRPTIHGNVDSFDWSPGAFTQLYGFPRCACVLNQRLVFAGTTAQPQTLWMSRTDDIANFDCVRLDDGALALTMSGQTQDPIRWMMSLNSRIMLGTAEGEFVVQSGSASVLTYANAVCVAHGFVGAADVDAICSADKVIFFERGGGRVMQYGYAYEQDAYLSTDLTVFADHVLQGGVVCGTALRKPCAKLVLVRADGQLACMTYNAMHNVHAWHRYTTEGLFKSVAALPNGNEDDSLFAVVQRDGAVYIEVMDAASPYVDHRGHDFVSTVVTNCLQCSALGSPRKRDARISFCLGERTLAGGIEVFTGGDWTRLDRAPQEELQPGWLAPAGFTEASYERSVGLRVRGEQGLVLYAIQG